MAAKAFAVLCAQALLIQSALGQCVSPVAVEARYASPYGLAGRGYGYEGLALDTVLPARGFGLGCGGTGLDYTPTSGGGLIVSSASAIAPVGVSVNSANVYEGILCAGGELPFVGTVGVDGVVPTAGAGAVNYGCGDGVTAMESVADVAPGIGFGEYGYGSYGASFAAPGLGYRGGLANFGCGGVLEY